jgi:zinc/manganese transport system ATP-binding protein/zinc transport system ATP-binding protein
VLELLREINQEGIAILLTTHDLHAVAASLPYIVCINGRIIAQGTPDAVFTSQVLSQTYNAPMDVVRHEGHLLVVEQTVSLAVEA